MSSFPEPEEEPQSKKPEPQEEPKPQEVKAVVRKLTREEMVAEVAIMFKSECGSHVPSVAEIGRWRSEWSDVRASRLKMAKEITAESEKRTKDGPLVEQKKSAKAKERTKIVLEERKASALILAECIVCGKPVSGLEEATRSSDGHFVHLACEDANRCERCMTETGFTIPAGTSRDLMMIVGHGSDDVESTFVPPGMTVYTFAAPGVGLPFEDGALALMNPRAATKAVAFDQGSTIPNMEVGPLTAAQLSGMQNVFRHANGNPDQVDWVSKKRRLCAARDPRECRPPFHSCKGLLRTYRGTSELYLVFCAGDAMPDEYSAETEGYDKLMRLIMKEGEKNSDKALSFYHSLNESLQAVLQLDADFVQWYDKALGSGSS